MTDPLFVDEVLGLFAAYDECESLSWRRAEDGSLEFFVNVGDVFHWGTADAETITPENLDELRKAFRDAADAAKHGEVYGDSLFAARIRGMRPQGAMYANLPEGLWPLFDACGPERPVDILNPKPQPGPRQITPTEEGS